MGDYLGVDCFGRKKVVSHYAACAVCGRRGTLSSYVTDRFLHIYHFPLIPLGRLRVLNECAHCGHRGTASMRSYKRLRKKELASMMEAFSSQAEDPDTVLHGIRTLMVYNEERWFLDIENLYGRRFCDHMQVQQVLAEGLFRFGCYEKAETYCRKAIVLGGRKKAEDLLALCQSMRDKEVPAGLEPESMLRPYAFLISVVAVFILTVVATGISATRNSTAWIVSGSPVPYTVEIDGHSHRIEPYGQKRIIMRLGEHQIQVRGLNGLAEPRSFSYENSLFKQKIWKHVFVMNPDGIAVLVEETFAEEESGNRYLFGETSYALQGIDFPFAPFNRLSIAKRNRPTRLYNYTASNTLSTVSFLKENGRPGDAANYARRILRIDPQIIDSDKLLEIAVNDLNMNEVVGFLRHGRNILPPVLSWHCFYQDYMAFEQPAYDLKTEYGSLCKRNPGVPEFYYLLGRVIPDHNTAKLFFEKSEEGAGCQGWGYHAIACEYLYAGEYNDALVYAEKAVEKSPENAAFEEVSMQAHLALGQYDLPLQQIQAHLGQDPLNSDWLEAKVKYLTLQGEHHAVDEMFNHYSLRGSNLDDAMQAARFYVSGNVKGYLQHLMRTDKESWEMQHHLHAGRVVEASRLLSKNEEHDYTAHLILYIAASYHGNAAIAEAQLAKAIAASRNSDRGNPDAARILSDNKSWSIEDLLDVHLMPSEKSILCAALGYQYSAERAEYFALSRKFNYSPVYPHLLLKKWTRIPGVNR